MRDPGSWISTLLLSFLLAAAAPAAVIDFETTPTGSTPTDDQTLANPYTDGTTVAPPSASTRTRTS